MVICLSLPPPTWEGLPGDRTPRGDLMDRGVGSPKSAALHLQLSCVSREARHGLCLTAQERQRTLESWLCDTRPVEPSTVACDPGAGVLSFESSYERIGRLVADISL